MNDLFHMKSKEFYENTNRRPEPEACYDVRIDKLETIQSIVRLIAIKSRYSFYGYEVIPDGADAIVRVRLDMFVTEDVYDEIFKDVSEFKLVPIDKQFLVEFKINNVYMQIS